MRKQYIRKVWTQEEDAIVPEKYPNTPNAELAKMMGRSVHSICGRAFKFNIRKTLKHLKSGVWVDNLRIYGAAHRFVKGGVALNKGKKMRPEVYEKVKRTMFKKGSTPPNAKPDKYERICAKDGYVLVRVSPQEFKLKHRLVWQMANGPVPNGMVVTFKDGNKLNCELSNLKLITMAENMLRNSIQNYPPEVKTTIKLLAKLNRKIHEKQND